MYKIDNVSPKYTQNLLPIAQKLLPIDSSKIFRYSDSFDFQFEFEKDRWKNADMCLNQYNDNDTTQQQTQHACMQRRSLFSFFGNDIAGM